MIAYLDSSVLLRIVLLEPDPLAEWDQLTGGVTSTLTQVEAARTFDRDRLLGIRSEAEQQNARVEIASILSRLDAIPIETPVLDEASRSLGTVLGTLDAIHLASAILYRAMQPDDERAILFATHDKQLANAARAMNFEVIGA